HVPSADYKSFPHRFLFIFSKRNINKSPLVASLSLAGLKKRSPKKEICMDVAEHIGKGVRLFLKVYLTLLVSCALLQMLMSWICSIRLSVVDKFELWLA